MSTIKTLLHFESIDEVPSEYMCLLCGGICSNHVQNFFKYFKPTENNCERQINNFCTYSQTSYFYNQITFNCKYCCKVLKAHKYFKHNMKCFEIFTQSPNFINSFQLIEQKEQKNFNCNLCQNLCYKPKQVDEIVICLVCCIQKKLIYNQRSPDINMLFQDQKVQCTKCQRIIQMQKSFKHYKQCVFPIQQEFQSFIQKYNIQWLKRFKQLSKIKMAKPRKIYDNEVNRINESNQLILQTQETIQMKNYIKKLKLQKQFILDEQD
ncbi:hypothetical protein pb186bvf_017375 [Paramecium bursaria]